MCSDIQRVLIQEHASFDYCDGSFDYKASPMLLESKEKQRAMFQYVKGASRVFIPKSHDVTVPVRPPPRKSHSMGWPTFQMVEGLILKSVSRGHPVSGIGLVYLTVPDVMYFRNQIWLEDETPLDRLSPAPSVD